MPKIHYANPIKTGFPYCAARIDMVKGGFLETEVKSVVTCKLCLMRLGVIPQTRGHRIP